MSTPSGTDSTTGAKFRMLVTPAATSRSQTSWAGPAGVVMTPIETRSAATMSSSSAKSRTTMSPIRSPTSSGAASSRATIRKPRVPKPE